MEDPLIWRGVLDPSLWKESFVAGGHRIADAAQGGDWTTVLEMLRLIPALESTGGALAARNGSPSCTRRRGMVRLHP